MITAKISRHSFYLIWQFDIFWCFLPPSMYSVSLLGVNIGGTFQNCLHAREKNSSMGINLNISLSSEWERTRLTGKLISRHFWQILFVFPYSSKIKLRRIIANSTQHFTFSSTVKKTDTQPFLQKIFVQSSNCKLALSRVARAVLAGSNTFSSAIYNCPSSH